MKILIIELHGADPGALFGDERLANIRRLMEGGCYGRLTRSPTLGNDAAPATTLIRDAVALQGKGVVLVGVSLVDPPREPNIICVGCRLARGAGSETYTHPPEVTQQISSLVGEYPAEVEDVGDDAQLHEAICAAARTNFELAWHFMQHSQWDCFHFAERGFDLLHRRRSAELIGNYFAQLDEGIGGLLELLSDDTAILIVSESDASGAREAGREGVGGGCFILAAPSNPLQEELQGVSVHDLAPTLLELSGYTIPAGRPGKSLVAWKTVAAPEAEDPEALLRARLRGLGYIE